LKNEKLQFEDYQRANLIRATNDVDFIKSEIANRTLSDNFIANLIQYLINFDDYRNYAQYVGELVTKDSFSSDIKALLIKSVGFYEEVSDELYINYIEFYMSDENCALQSSEKADLILSLKTLKSLQERSLYKNTEYSNYEIKLFSYLQDEGLGLSAMDKSRLVTDTKNFNFYTHSIFDTKISMDSACIANIIRAYQFLPGVSSEKYSNIISSIVKSWELKIEGQDIVALLKDLDKFPELKEANKDTEKYGKISQYDLTVFGLILDDYQNEKRLQKEDRTDLLKSINNIEMLDFFIKSKMISPEQKASIILAGGNREYIISCVEDPNLYLGFNGKAELLKSLNDSDLLKEYVERGDVLTSKEKCTLILATQDETYIKQCIEDKKINLTPLNRAMLIAKGVQDEGYRKRSLNNEDLEFDLQTYDALVDEIGDESEKENWNSKVLKVKGLFDISLEELEQTEKSVIEIEDSVEDGDNYYFYTKEEFIEIKKKMDEILSGIEMPIKGNEESEIKTFLEVTKRLAYHISYDQYAISEEGEKEYTLQRECRNLYGGLVKGESVCAGYANILKEALACVGIEAKFISGFYEEKADGHAWNQVKIGNSWYNVDLTWERDKIVRTGDIDRGILKSDQEFEDHLKYARNRTTSEEKCCNSMSGKDVLSEKYRVNKQKKTDEVEM